jgi:hypothetical protein
MLDTTTTTTTITIIIIIITRLSELLESHATAYSMLEYKSFRNTGLIPDNPVPGNKYPIRSESYSYGNESHCSYVEVSLPLNPSLILTPIQNPITLMRTPKPHNSHLYPHYLQSVIPSDANVQEYANI